MQQEKLDLIKKKEDQKKAAKALQNNLFNDISTLKTQMEESLQKIDELNKMPGVIEQLQKKVVSITVQLKLTSMTKPKTADQTKPDVAKSKQPTPNRPNREGTVSPSQIIQSSLA